MYQILSLRKKRLVNGYMIGITGLTGVIGEEEPKKEKYHILQQQNTAYENNIPHRATRKGNS